MHKRKKRLKRSTKYGVVTGESIVSRLKESNIEAPTGHDLLLPYRWRKKKKPCIKDEWCMWFHGQVNYYARLRCIFSDPYFKILSFWFLRLNTVSRALIFDVRAYMHVLTKLPFHFQILPHPYSREDLTKVTDQSRSDPAKDPKWVTLTFTYSSNCSYIHF